MRLDELITKRTLMSLAGDRSFNRGEEYRESGAVGRIAENNGTISAKVRGTHVYEVRLMAEGNGGIDYSCTCPVGRDGEFCKHCVALGLAWIDGAAGRSDQEKKEASTEKNARKSGQEVTLKDIRMWLEGQETKLLIDMLMEQIKTSGRLREALTLKVAKTSVRGIDLSAYRKAMRSAFQISGFVDYHDMHEYSAEVNEAIESIERVFHEGFAEDAMLLCEYALEQAALAVEHADDSDGQFSEFSERLHNLHLSACKVGIPDPVELAQRLFALEAMDNDLDIFSGAALTYRTLLGKSGLAEYRRLAEEKWASVPAKKPGSRDESYSGKRFRITSIMESLARADGDADALIEVKKRDLSHPYAFLEIAEICKKARRNDDALSWAESGLKAFPEDPDNRLRDFAAGEYHRCKRYDEAYRLYRIQFIERPRLEEYQKLMGYAKKIDRAAPAREDALAFLRQSIKKEKNDPRAHTWYHKPDHSPLVEIFLWEKNSGVAWSEATAGGCNDQLWRELAKVREKDYPADAVNVYKRLVEPLIEQKNNQAYDEAYRMVIKIRELMQRMEQSAEFSAYAEDLRARHKPKRNLMKLLANL
ncbi:MAG TPA: hypothetical protein VLH56_14545 [Dissulfurispiraceae bacterium]|nr:hypothetical protein [Dissulfurispiraceae bacterium]